MSLAATLNRSTQSFSEFWSARNPREQAMLAAAAAVALLALIYMLLISPAQSGREQLAKSLPALRQQAAQLQALAKEASGLSSDTPAPEVQPVSKESVEAALARKGIKAQSVAVTGEIVRLQLPSVSFSGLIGWLDEMQKNALLSVEEATIVALPQPDMVNATLMLHQRKPE